MRARQIWGTAAAVAVAGMVIACGSGGAGDSDEAAEAPANATMAAAKAVGQAQAVVDAIDAKWSAPNPRDTTSGCAAKEGDTGTGCVSRITTDAVTVIELANEGDAKEWATTMGEAGEATQAGRFVLTWNSEQEKTSEKAREGMVSIAMAASEKS